jgi:hypothetical protein
MECEASEGTDKGCKEDISNGAADTGSTGDDTDVLYGHDNSFEEAPDCGPGTYRKQDLAARQWFMRENGLKPLANGRILPKRVELDESDIPTFYADESQKEHRLKARNHLLARIGALNNPEKASLIREGDKTSNEKKTKKKRKKRTESNATLPDETVEEPPRKKKKKKKKSTMTSMDEEMLTSAKGASIEELALRAIDEDKKRRAVADQTRDCEDKAEDLAPNPPRKKKKTPNKRVDMDLARKIAQLVFEKQKAEILDEKLKKGVKQKKTKKKVNIRMKNWIIAMRRNFQDNEKEKALSPFTISRREMHKVPNEKTCVYLSTSLTVSQYLCPGV